MGLHRFMAVLSSIVLTATLWPTLNSFADETSPENPTEVTDTSSGSASIQDYKKIEIPNYKTAHPKWGLEAVYAPSTFSKAPQIAASALTVNSFSVSFEYQPPIIQAMGVVSLVATAGTYFVEPQGSLTAGGQDFYSYGAQFRYQAKYFTDQPLVPFVGYGIEYFRYHFTNSSLQDFNRSGPIVGIMLSTSFLDSHAMQEFYQDWGVSRAYAVAEMRSSSSGDETLPTSPKTWYLGIRLEF